VAVPTLSDFQVQYGDDGVLMNTDPDNVNPFIDIEEVSGLDSAEYRTSSKDTEGWDGSVVEAEFESKRTITITGVIYSPSYTLTAPYIDLLKANFAVSKTYKPLYFKEPGVASRRSMAKCTSGFRCNWNSLRRIGRANFSVTLVAGDTIIYGVTETLWSGNFTTTNIPGFTFPFAFNFDFGAVSGASTGLFSASHSGNRPAPFVARFTTPSTATNPGLLHEGLGRGVQTSLSLVSGDVLEIDFNKRQVLYNGSPRRGSVTREGWFLLQSGIANPLRLLMNSGSLAVTLSVYDAWR
jgi:hypothetical protein